MEPPLPRENAPSHPTARVLLAEDDDDLRAACARALEIQGFEVTVAANGEQALQLLDGGTFDVLVSDVRMPRLGGAELLRAVRQRDLDLPVLLMTGSPDVAEAAHALANGALRYFVKPFSPRELGAAVREASALNQLARLKREVASLVAGDAQQFGDRAGLECAFERALESMWMAFQPLVSLAERRVFAYEALLRTDERFLASPGALLAAGERLGRLHAVGRRVRALVAQQMAHAGERIVFVNLHERELLDEDLYSPAAPLSAFARRVVLEVSERVSFEELSDMGPRCAALRRLGYRLAIDNLGAGYAGSKGFDAIHPEVVKFDMSLVRGIHTSAAKRRVVGSMTELFRSWNTGVVAEGVETPGERDVLARLGCDVVQGFLFGRPARGFSQPTL